MNSTVDLIISRASAVVLVFCLISCDGADTAQSGAQSTPTGQTFQYQQEDLLKSQLFDDPNNFDALSRLGDVQFEAGNYMEAIKTYDRAIAVNPQCADCLNDKGLALYYTGAKGEALDAVNSAIRINPAYTHAYLSKGFMLVNEGRHEEAIEPLMKVKELDGAGGLSRDADNFLAAIEQARLP